VPQGPSLSTVWAARSSGTRAPGGKGSVAKRRLADALTCCNLAAGIVAVLSGPGNQARRCDLVLLAALCDTLDGPLARHSGHQRELGAIGDGVADLVSFGIAPAVLVSELGPRDSLSTLFPGLFIAAATWRLVRYGVGPRTTDVFSGLPLTGAGIVLAAALRAGASPGSARRLATALAFSMVSGVPVPSGAEIVRRVGAGA